MFRLLSFTFIAFLSLPITPFRAHAVQTYEDVTERDVPIKKSLPLYLQHRLGNVTVQGWVQDRIRVTIKKHMVADTEVIAKKEFTKLDLITLETAQDFEIRMGHTQGTDLVTKMHDEVSNPVLVDLEIKAPYQSALTVVLGDGKKLSLQEWRGGVKITGKNDTLQLSKLSMVEPIFVNCIQCQTEVRESKISGHLLIGGKPISLSDIDGKEGLFIDEGNDEVRIDDGKGKINVHTKSGRLTANKFVGDLAFESIDGGAFVNQFAGDLSVQTQSGQVMVDVDPGTRNTLELDTDKSDIQVSLPTTFTGGLDLMSLRGEIVVQFAYEAKKTAPDTYGPASPGRVEGTVGTDQKIRVHAYSKQGGVRLLRKAIK